MNYEELVKALRSRSVLCETPDCDACEAVHFVCTDKILHDAAAAIDDLQAEVKRLEPKQRKLGRWEKAKPKGVIMYSDGYAECSSCHEAIWLGWGMNFCPHCGVQNRIIDPDDMAKMEAQDG